VFWIHDILGWSGSGSSDPCFWLMDPDPAIFVIDLQHASKRIIFNTIFSAYYFFKVHLHHFSKIKGQKESQNIRNQGFSYYFCMMIEGSGSSSIPLTSGSGSWRPKSMRIRWILIRLRIRNTGFSIVQCTPWVSSHKTFKIHVNWMFVQFFRRIPDPKPIFFKA
jgi:hypothetical protein